MARTARALRLESEKLRRSGWTFAAIAKDWCPRYAMNPRVALRLAHGLTQSQVAAKWNDLWPDLNPKTAKHISYWEIWPDAAGRAPSLETLNRLALIYQCSAGDLLGGEDYTHLDSAASAAVATQEHGRGNGVIAIQLLTVSVAVVLNDAKTLLVCRRDDGGGLWQQKSPKKRWRPVARPPDLQRSLAVPKTRKKPTDQADPLLETALFKARAAGGTFRAEFAERLGRPGMLRLARMFKTAAMPQRPRERKSSPRITAAHLDWKAGGVALYRKHIRNWPTMNRYRRACGTETADGCDL